MLQGIGANAPFTTIGGLDNTWLQGRRATRFFINDNLAWSHGAHELRFGTNIRIFRLNDYDFGEGTVPTVTYTTLPQFIYGVASTVSKTFPTAANEPFNFLNLDFYAQDTWKLSPSLTWTFGLRDTDNSNPLNPHYQVARLDGSFYSIAHDVNQPLNQVNPDRPGQSSLRPLRRRFCNPEWHLPGSYSRNTVLRTGFGVFSDILPGSVADLVGNEPAVRADISGWFAGQASAAQPSRPAFPIVLVDALPSRPIRRFTYGVHAGCTLLRIAALEFLDLAFLLLP